jgi:hypothetical protein
MRMTKTLCTLIAAAVLAAGPAFAGDKACCATASGKTKCSQVYAKLDLTPEQKAKLDSFQQSCEKDGCTDASMQKFMVEAKGVLSPEQYTQLKNECSRMEKHAPKAGS